MTINEIIDKLKEGNRKYLAAEQNGGDISPAIRKDTTDNGQHPYAVVIACSDSRVIPENIFMTGIGELFVIRVAGNVIADHQLGSIEYAVDHLGSPLVLVLGHTHCGAVGAAISGHADSFIKIRNIITVVSLVLIVVLVFVSFFIMSNTIKLATYSRREEIGIMKMVGASNSFIRTPFVIEGLVLGMLGSLLAFVVQWALYNALCNRITSAFAVSFLHIVPFTSVRVYVLAGFLAVGVIVGTFGGVNAIRNYLKV